MNKNTFIAITLIIITLCIILFVSQKKSEPAATPNEPISSEADDAIRAQVTEFGSKLKNVSLLMSPTDVRSQMELHYGKFLTPELLLEWQREPAKALGRSVSSPWPDRIEVVSITNDDNTGYKVEGNVIEVTSADKPLEPTAIYPVTLTVQKRDGDWLISSMTKGAYSEMPKRITVEGIWECLPHKNSSGPQTMECAFGIVLLQLIFQLAQKFE
jgi:hypothetical protein